MRIKEDLLQSIYEFVNNRPGVCTPIMCLELHEGNEIKDKDSNWATDSELVAWLIENHSEVWEKTCAHLDHLIEEGDIIFTDDGNLYSAVYEGEIIGQRL